MVTGAAGFVGGHLLDKLARDGWYSVIRALDLPGAWSPAALARAAAAGAEVVRGDVTDGPAMRALCTGATVVFHLAAIVDTRCGPLHLPRLWRVNVEGTRCLLAGAAAAGVPRFVHLSSTAAATGPTLNPPPAARGWSEDQFPCRVAAGKAPKELHAAVAGGHPYASDYGLTKAVSEYLVLAASTPRMRTVALRPHTILGPNDACVCDGKRARAPPPLHACAPLFVAVQARSSSAGARTRRSCVRVCPLW